MRQRTDSAEHRVYQPAPGLTLHWMVGRHHVVGRLGGLHWATFTTPTLARHRRWHDTDAGTTPTLARHQRCTTPTLHDRPSGVAHCNEQANQRSNDSPRRHEAAGISGASRVCPFKHRAKRINCFFVSSWLIHAFLPNRDSTNRPQHRPHPASAQPGGQQYRQPAPSDDLAASSRRLATRASTRSMSFARLNGLRRISDPSTASRKPAL